MCACCCKNILQDIIMAITASTRYLQYVTFHSAFRLFAYIVNRERVTRVKFSDVAVSIKKFKFESLKPKGRNSLSNTTYTLAYIYIYITIHSGKILSRDKLLMHILE